MAAKTIKITPLGQRKKIEEFSYSEMEAAIETIRLHLRSENYQNTITENEISLYSKLLERKKDVIIELVERERGLVVTIEQRARIKRRELVEA